MKLEEALPYLKEGKNIYREDEENSTLITIFPQDDKIKLTMHDLLSKDWKVEK